MTSVFVDVHRSKAKLTLFRDGNSFLIVSTACAWYLQQMFPKLIADGSTRSSRDALCDHRSSRCDVAFHRSWAETNPNMRKRFHVSWWNSDVSKYSAASLECVVHHFGQYGIICMWNMIWLCKVTIVIPQLPSLFRMAKAVPSTIKLVNSVTCDSVNLFNFAMIAFASKCFPIELVPCSDGWPRTWWQTIHMMPGLPVPSILQCK